MALDGPETRIELRPAPHALVTGREAERARHALCRLESALELNRSHALHVAAAIPAHAGLGSGTQLALSIGAALRRLHGLEPDPAADAELLGRGARSGIGIALFSQGGFVVDGGRGESTSVPPLLARLPVPPDWRVLLLRDPDHQGLFGEQEQKAFRDLPPMTQDDAARLCRLTLMQVLPALAEADLPHFGAAVSKIQRIMGAYFAPAQGGVFASAKVGAALRWLEGQGACSTGQTSWGPSGFAFVNMADAAEALAHAVANMPEAAGLIVTVQQPRNHGAHIQEA